MCGSVNWSRCHAINYSSFWSKNQFVIKIYACRTVWGLIGYGCRLAVVAHGFGIGHFGLCIRKLSKTGVTKKWSFSGHGPTPENSDIFFEFVSMLVKLSENVFWG